MQTRVRPLSYSSAPFLAGFLLLAACRPEPPAPSAEPPAAPVADAADAPTGAAPDGVQTDGMVLVPGGTTRIGSEPGDPVALPTERPAFDAAVAPFYLDRSPATVARFAAFVEATGYTTEAEHFGSAGVLVEGMGWGLVPGAMWQRPLGLAGPPAPADHPVTQVSWNDAVAFCAWAGGRLPTEVEWEHAARGAVNRRSRYAWGDSLEEHGHHHANTWNGPFPVHNTAADGYLTTSPVGAFGATDLGLTDLGGNVWEWTADWFRPYAERDRPFTPTAASERVQRGGSFLCHASYCHGYRAAARSHSTPESALFNVGFRCARDA